MLRIAAGQWQQHQATAPVGCGSRARAEAQGLRSQVRLRVKPVSLTRAASLPSCQLGLPSVRICWGEATAQEHGCTLEHQGCHHSWDPLLPPRSSSVFMERELTLDGAIVSAVFHESMDMGVVGTTAGTLWYVSWAEGTSTRLISGHRSKVRLLGHWLSVKDVPGGFHPGQRQGWEPHIHSSLSVLSPCPQLSF